MKLLMLAREAQPRLLHRLADLLERDTDQLIDLMVKEIGTPRAVACILCTGHLSCPQLPLVLPPPCPGAAGPDKTLPATAAADSTATLC